MFTDRPSHACIGSVLRWCDIAHCFLYDSMPDPAVRREYIDLFNERAFNRTNVVEMLTSGDEWERAVSWQAKAMVNSSVTRVGRTSWGVEVEIVTSLGVPLARVSQVLVATDKESKPTPVPHVDDLKALVHETPSIEPPSVCARPPDPFVHSVEVPKTSCDTLGHVNNASYADLVENAKHACARRARINDTASPAVELLTVVARRFSIDYIGQLYVGDALDVAIWWDEFAGAFGFEFSVSGNVVARGAVEPRRGAPGPSAL